MRRSDIGYSKGIHRTVKTCSRLAHNEAFLPQYEFNPHVLPMQ